MPKIVIAALYHFTAFDDPASLRAELTRACRAAKVMGTVLLAREGINGTIAGSRPGIDAVLAAIRALPGCAALEHKESFAREMPFLRMKVRLKKEIVTMGQPQVKPRSGVGTYVAPEDWNALTAEDDVVVIDTRNDYEVSIGSFDGAIDPHTASFSAFPDWWQSNQHRFHNKRIAMFCTGGIRCEKSTNYLLDQGVSEVFHLRGGILKYLETVKPADSTWNGECFVFDSRVSVGHGLNPGSYHLCYACRRPITDQDMTEPSFEAGVSCRYCIDEYDDARRARFRERQKQVALAAARGTRHIGQKQT